MLSQVVTNQLGIKRSKIGIGCYFENPRGFENESSKFHNGSSTNKDPEGFVEEMKKVFKVMQVVYVEPI